VGSDWLIINRLSADIARWCYRSLGAASIRLGSNIKNKNIDLPLVGLFSDNLIIGAENNAP